MSQTRFTVEFLTDVSPIATSQKYESLRNLRNVCRSIVGGATHNSSTVTFRTGTARASGNFTISSGSGTVGGSINGVSITVTWGTSDTATATALAAAINASTNALVQNVVTASASSGVVTITAVQGGVSGNMVTLSETGTGVTKSGARLTGGSETYNTFTF